MNTVKLLSRSLRVILSVSALSCAPLSMSYADEGNDAPTDAASVTQGAPEATNQAPKSATPPAAAPKESSATPTQAPTQELSPAELAKELRLEELRYKHLWIAYSIVWLVIFMFIRSTWKRSEAVAGRLDELKGRVKRLEEARSREES